MHNTESKIDHVVKSRFLRILLIAAGWVSLGLGVLGIILPVLPTTIFVILAAYCFLKSSPVLHGRLTGNKIFGKYIRDFQNDRSMPLSAKFMSIIMLNSSIGYSAVFLVDNMILKILLFVVALSVTIYILSVRTRKPAKEAVRTDDI